MMSRLTLCHGVLRVESLFSSHNLSGFPTSHRRQMASKKLVQSMLLLSMLLSIILLIISATQIGDWYDVVIPGSPAPPPIMPAQVISDVCDGKESGIVVRPFHSEISMPSGTGTTVTIRMQCGWPTWLSSVRLGFCALGLIAFSHFSYKLWSTTLSTGINTKQMKHCMAVVAVVLTAHCAFDSYRVGYVKSQVPSESDAAYLPARFIAVCTIDALTAILLFVSFFIVTQWENTISGDYHHSLNGDDRGLYIPPTVPQVTIL